MNSHFFLNTNLTDLTNLDTALQCQSSNWNIRVITLTIKSVGGYINWWLFVFKKKHMRCFLGNEQRMHINYMQSKISVIRAIRVQKKRIYMRCLLGKEQRMSLYFSEHESHGSHEFRHCKQCQSSNWLISTITLTINSVGGYIHSWKFMSNSWAFVFFLLT